jgi:signal transduction histidine kinase/DNA-binding response OmpR family regulator/HAMP domain-containing protein
MTANSYSQQVRLSNLNSQFQIWLEWETTEIVEGRRKVNKGQLDMSNLIEVAQTGHGKENFDKIRNILNAVVQEEQDLLEIRNNHLVRLKNQTAVVMSLGGILAAFLAVIISILVIRMVVDPIITVTNTFKEISEGDTDLEIRLNINSNDELGRMSKYFNTFMCKLKEIMLENWNQSWLKSGQAELDERMRGEQSVPELAENIITYISKYLNIQIGALYTKVTEDTFRLSASYAYYRSKDVFSEIKIGEGILGQAARDKNAITIKDVPEDYIKINSGLGERVPKNIIVVPLLHNNEVLGLVELGSFNDFTDIEMKFLNQIAPGIAHTIYSAEARIRMNELLYKTMEQSEELQTQQEELRQNNEELEEQAKALIESEAHLQRQQEELRVANEELQEYANELELQRNDISAKNKSLRNAQIEVEEKAKDLELASKYKSEFLANMSHELRTPLNSILVLSQMLAEKKDSSPLSYKELEFAKTIHSSGSDLLRLINDILDLSKVEAGKMDINLEEMDLSELAQYVDRTFSTVAAKKGLYLNLDIDKRLPRSIISDIQRVQQIINNLISNAIKFTGQGGVTVSFHTVKDKGFMGISIADTGIGIPFSKQQIIFEAFKQSDGTTSRKYGGTGLGLSISTELAKLLGGAVSLTSEEGKGSVFTLLLPYEDTINEDKEKDHNISMDSVSAKDIVPNIEDEIYGNIDDRDNIKAEDKLILIIEDDNNFSKVLLELVHRKEYKCLIAEDGTAGIKLAMKYKPDAILLDIGLPDINGWVVVQSLKENKETENIPVHVISGRECYGTQEKMSNIISYLNKPVSLDSLNEIFIKIHNNIQEPLKKLLILDENKDKSKAIVDTLGSKGFQVRLSDSGSEAYDLLTAEEYDCLILDLKLKDMTGLQLLDKLKDERLEKLKVIIHTERQLSEKDELMLQKYAQSIIIKGTQSTERLISEVSLFLHDLDLKMKEKKIKITKSEHEKQDVLNNKKVLLVDDDMRNIFSLTSILEERGLNIVVGRNGKEAIQKLSENSDIDLILMDIMMPEMDGYTAIQEIRRQERFYSTPIIAITAKAMKDDRQRCIDAGANDYLTKPIDIDKLISLLRVWLYR